jgi:hypothetical protein
MRGSAYAGEVQSSGFRRLIDHRGVRATTVGVLAFVVVVALGAELALHRRPVWTAGTSMVILPDPAVARWVAEGAEEALNSGQVAMTVAEFLRSPAAARAAAARSAIAGQSSSPEITVAVTVVPSTTVLQVFVSAPTRGLAEATADSIASTGSAYLRSTLSPFRLVVLTPAGGSARENAHKTPVSVTLLAVAGIVGMIAQQAWYRFLTARASRRRRRVMTAEATTTSLAQGRVGEPGGGHHHGAPSTPSPSAAGPIPGAVHAGTAEEGR